MNNALMYFGGVLVVVLGALFAVPAFVDWNGYRGVFEEEASRVLGREVRVGGGVNLRILPTPYVSFDKVRLADTIGQTGEPFVRAENFTMRLAIAPILRGDIEVNEIELNKPVLTLALDGQGGGNWSSVALKSGTLPFLPQNVSLRSVKITDGQISILSPEAATVGRIEAVNGELAADSLNGPFKFKGLATWGGQKHDIKVATAAAGNDGNLALKATSHTEGSSNTFSLDGKLQDVLGKPKLTGDLTAKLPVPGSSETANDKKADDALIWDFKSRLTADASGAAFDEIAMSLDGAAEPQVISGTAKSAWNDAGRFDISLASNFLDIDRLSGSGQDSATYKKLELFSIGLMKAVGGGGSAGAKLAIEQVKIGGETTGGLMIDAERGAGGLTIKTLHMGVPGGAKLHVSGTLKDEDGKASFAGSGFIHGGSLRGLLSWAEKSGAKIDIKADGAFNVGGKFVFNDTGFELSGLSGEIAGRPFSGSVSRTGGEHKRLALTLEAATLDSADIFPSANGLLKDQIRAAFGLEEPPKNGAPKDVTGAQMAEDMTLRLIAGELKDGSETFRNVDVTLGFEHGEIRIPLARLTTSRGLAVAVEGRIKNANAEPAGQLAYEFTAATPEAMKDIVSVFGFGGIVSEDKLAVLGPSKAAGIIRLGERAKGAADLTIDGLAGTSRISGTAEFDTGLSGWRTGPARAQIVAKAADLKTVTALLGGDAGKALPPSRPADVRISLAGSVARGAVTVADIVSEGLQATYAGLTRLPDAGDASAEGTLTLKAAELSDVLSIAGIVGAGGLEGVPVEGRLSIARNGGAWQISSEKLGVGNTLVSGAANLSTSAAESPKIEATLQADRLSVEALLAGVSGKRPPLPAEAGVETPAPLWPGQTFALDQFGALTGTVHIAFANMSLGERWGLRDGAMKMAFQPGKVSVRELSGKAAGGELNGSLDFEKLQGGIGLSAKLTLDGIALSSLSAAAKGTSTIDFAVTGRGSSPATIVQSLSGQGQIAFKDAIVPGPSTRTGADLIDAVVQNEVKNDAQSISGALEGFLSSATVNAGTRTVPLVIANGIAKTEPQAFESGQDKLSVMAQANLATLAFESSWRVSSVMPPLAPAAGPVEGWSPPPDRGPLPPVVIAYNGQLDRLSELEPQIESAELQRELTVRQMERNVSELERVRKQDEQRVRQDLERRKAAEAERAAAAAAAAAQRAAARNAEPAQAPPVIPQSNGTPEPSALRPWTANPQPIEPPVQPGAASTVQRGRGAPQVPVGETEIEPGDGRPNAATGTNEPPPQASPPQANAGPNALLPVPPAAPAKPARPKPRPPLPERTTADELSRALGRYP